MIMLSTHVGKKALRTTLVIAVLAAMAIGGLVSYAPPQSAAAAGAKADVYKSPYDVAYSADGKFLAVSDRTSPSVAIIDPVASKVAKTVDLKGEPGGLAWSGDNTKVYVAECGNGTVAEVDAAAGKVLRRLPVGVRPNGVAIAAKKQLLLAANTVTNDVTVVDLATGKEKALVPASHQPFSVAVTPDESLALVANAMPAVPASDPGLSAAITLVDLEKVAAAGEIRLPAGSSSVRQIVVSADGKWAYVAHTVGRTTLPTTQLERGWVNTNALSILDLTAKKHYATVLLDFLSEGGADPWGVAIAKDGKTLWVSLAGIHQIAKIDLLNLHHLMAAEPAEGDAAKRTMPSIWTEIKQDPKKRELLVNDLAALYGPGLITRTTVPFKGPRGISLSPDGSTLAVAAYFSGCVLATDPATAKVTSIIPLGPATEPDLARKGEIIFNDANYCFQHWLSCATCHPDNARADGLNWDLLNDGIGNPKNTKSLLQANERSPVMAHGVRANMDVAVLAGFRFILFREPEKADLEAVGAYLKSLKPDPSPYLSPKGGLTDKAKKGKAIFESSKTGCATCHTGPMFTDQKPYDVGTKGPLDNRSDFITSTLTELWRTGPYLHTGDAVTIQEIFSKFNPKDQHGKTSRRERPR